MYTYRYCTYIHTLNYTHMYMYIYIYTHIFRLYMCVCVYIYIYIYTYADTSMDLSNGRALCADAVACGDGNP